LGSPLFCFGNLAAGFDGLKIRGFETRRHGEHRGGGLWVLGQRLRGLCGSVFFKVCAMDGARSGAVFLKHGGTESTEEGGFGY
jgi:hypothetical protein